MRSSSRGQIGFDHTGSTVGRSYIHTYMCGRVSWEWSMLDICVASVSNTHITYTYVSEHRVN